MPEIWYRGEAIGDVPASPGSTAPHDLGDGMYLTDSQRLAKAYAELRTTDPTKQRVYSVSIDRSSLRVLDLTKDLRWQQHVKPVEPILKTGNANEMYGRTFENFVRNPAYKIDLNNYNAVIGHDYVRGGKQICILYKNGKPTRLHVSVRRTFQPLTPSTTRVRSWAPHIKIRESGVRIVDGIAGRHLRQLAV
jgi:hypothetical protein